MNFRRAGSRVWWGSDGGDFRGSPSPASQEDSGFSDAETSPKHLGPQGDTPKKEQPARRIPKDIFKELSKESDSNNLSENYREKSTPNKEKIGGERARSEGKAVEAARREFGGSYSDPVKKQRFNKNPSPKVSRNLFAASKNNNNNSDDDNEFSDGAPSHKHSNHARPAQRGEDATDGGAAGRVHRPPDEDDAAHAFDSLSSDCESELERLFVGPPLLTSTPKAAEAAGMRPAGRRPLEVLLKAKLDRVLPQEKANIVDNPSVQKWLAESRLLYDPECMTTIQCKSISVDIHQKVAQLAATITNDIREILNYSRTIESDYKQLNNDTKYMNCLIQGIADNILDFLKSYTREISSSTLKLSDEIRLKAPNETLSVLSKLFAIWEQSKRVLLLKHVKILMERLETPSSELDLKATVTGITSICLRYEELIEMFVSCEAIPFLLIFCEKCEGSSTRTLLLRALSTMCCNAEAVRQLEKYSGVQLIADVLDEDSRPEPERTEAAALLAQATAPWIEGNGQIHGLKECSKRLVVSLTKFLTTASCGQTLLLSTAALANLASTDSSSIQHMLKNETATILLTAASNRRHATSIHLLEQIAGLLAALAGANMARRQLCEAGAVAALVFFIGVAKRNHDDEDSERRLLQKSIVALSRLCGEKDACRRVVELDGAMELVGLCREKDQRRDSDAVLVAALATLRKVVDACGSDILCQQDVQELIRPKLLDSFLAYSTQNESYV